MWQKHHLRLTCSHQIMLAYVTAMRAVCGWTVQVQAADVHSVDWKVYQIWGGGADDCDAEARQLVLRIRRHLPASGRLDLCKRSCTPHDHEDHCRAVKHAASSCTAGSLPGKHYQWAMITCLLLPEHGQCSQAFDHGTAARC
jgi:hypothetical protein